MSTPAQWAELVTTALLGTDRRPLQAPDPPVRVLHEAVRHRVIDRLSAPQQSADPPPEPAPAQDDPAAPSAADQLLTDLLRAPDPVLITHWLRACARHRRTIAAIRWTPLARLAARTTAYDRVALGAALGPRGRWFLHQNPEWRKLAAGADRCLESSPVEDPTPSAALTADQVLADPERLLGHPQPWSPALVSAAYAVLGGAGQVPPARTFATRLGVALPAALYPSIAQAAEYYLLAPDASPARRRAIRDRFVALELAAYAHAAIEQAFSTDGPTTDSSSAFIRAEIPHV